MNKELPKGAIHKPKLEIAPSAPLDYIEYERKYYAGSWYFRLSSNDPWQLCRERE